MGSYAKSARFYDALYADKDYEAEAESLTTWLRSRGVAQGSLLDIACGTGRHLQCLGRHFECQGLDLEAPLLEIARARVPQVALHQGDMTDFDLGRKFDIVTCWFGSIGYLQEESRLKQALKTWAGHLRAGGWICLEPWIFPETFRPRMVHATFVDQPDFKLTRMVVSHAEGSLYSSDFHYLMATPDGVQHFVEKHELRMFTREQYERAFKEAGLTVEFEPDSITARGMFLAHH